MFFRFFVFLFLRRFFVFFWFFRFFRFFFFFCFFFWFCVRDRDRAVARRYPRFATGGATGAVFGENA